MVRLLIIYPDLSKSFVAKGIYDEAITLCGSRVCVYNYRVRGMIYTTNWIERLQRDFRHVLRQRSSMPGELVITLMDKVAIEKKSMIRANNPLGSRQSPNADILLPPAISTSSSRSSCNGSGGTI